MMWVGRGCSIEVGGGWFDCQAGHHLSNWARKLPGRQKLPPGVVSSKTDNEGFKAWGQITQNRVQGKEMQSKTLHWVTISQECRKQGRLVKAWGQNNSNSKSPNSMGGLKAWQDSRRENQSMAPSKPSKPTQLTSSPWNATVAMVIIHHLPKILSTITIIIIITLIKILWSAFRAGCDFCFWHCWHQCWDTFETW